MRFLFLALAMILFLPVASTAQEEDDRGFLTRTIEDSLSGAGREVRVEGFQGALSSEASFERMTIADRDGVWLTLSQVTLNWSRTALLRGRLQVDELRAVSLDVPRLPVPEEKEVLPSAEAEPFELALPELPVSINVDSFEVENITLGEPLIGVPVALGVSASARLNEDGLNVDLSAERKDETAGTFGIKMVVDRETAQVELDLDLDEAPGGIAARLLKLPGQPSVLLSVAGQGPLDDFTTEIDLSTDGQQRLEGEVELLALQGGVDGLAPDRQVKANVQGDITALVATEYREFFGPDVGLATTALLAADGSIDVQSFDVNAQSLALSGKVRLNTELWPEFIDVSGQIARDGAPVLLPGSDAGITVESVLLDVKFDALAGDSLTGSFAVFDLSHEAIEIGTLQLGVDGLMRADPTAVGEVLADISFSATDLQVSDEDATSAIGRDLTGYTKVSYVEGEPTRISSLSLQGVDYNLNGDIEIEGLTNGFPTQLDVSASAEDLSRFTALAGRELSGAVKLDVSGMVTPLAGIFDLEIQGETQDISVEVPQADPLLAGKTTLKVSAARDATGTFVRKLIVDNAAVNVDAKAEIKSTGSDVEGRASLSDVSLVLPQYQGALSLNATAGQNDAGEWLVDVTAQAPYDSTLSVQGLATGPDADVVFDLLVPQLASYVPQVEGSLDASGRVQQADEGYTVDVSANGPYQSKVAVEGLATGPNAAVSFVASLPNVNVLIPDFSGPLNLEGDVARQGERLQVDTVVQGPSGTTSTIAGTVAADASDVDLKIAGSAPLGLSAPFLRPRSLTGDLGFDLAVRGAPSLAAVSGTVTTTDAKFTAPNLRIALQNIATTVSLSEGLANIDVGADILSGGRAGVTGSVNLNTLVSDLAISLQRAVLVDPRIYSAVFDAGIAVQGPLTGGANIAGRIDLGEVNVTIPGSGVTSIGAIPDIRHVGARPEVEATKVRAGLSLTEKPQEASAGPAFGLDIAIVAPGQIFVRGRGLNAELGGELKITGTTNAPISSGDFELIRGRMDVIGKRFDLDEGSIQFQGSTTPYIRFVSTTSIPDGTASITVEGNATEPEISFTSSPEAPEDEVLALIIFGRYVSELSAFQALQLVNGVAELSGRSGVGVLGSVRGGIGLDELDVTTTESGETQVTAGKYLTDTIYTDVTTSATEGTDISINIDLTDNLTGRATVGGEGESSLGLFFERDY